ncbi:MAG: DUF262 domain-containing protein [Alishewanella agri]|nr:DUF262 domain-containing protein [Alishewanella agri]
MPESIDILNNGPQLSFIQLFHDFDLTIEIPIIQRDYAQGRSQAAEVRESFLQALFNYLESNRSFNDLDFVYGSVTNERKFIPLDGQQRLTTLFLLHWYLAQSANAQKAFRSIICPNNLSRFTYETRSSSREFCDALVTNPFVYELVKDSSSEKAISAVLKDQPWFFMSWCFDPTIQAMLNMLDAIHLKFRGKPAFYQRLLSKDSPAITFRFLNLNKFLLTDDLYIKMNARGKPLTAFENFKAKLEQKIKTLHKPLPVYNFNEAQVAGYDYFIYKIDNQWADIFWPYRNVATEDNTFDDELMNFIGLFIAQYHLPRSSVHVDQAHKLLFEGSKVKRLSIDEYDKANVLSTDLLTKLIEILDLLNANSQEHGITLYLPNNPYYQEEDIFKKVLSNSTSYTERLRFYAFYNAVAEGKRDQELLEWMRVVFNLTEHTIFNDFNEYYLALFSLNKLLRHQAPILELLRDNVEIRSFAEHQVFEEKLKAHLLLKSEEWRNNILQLEQHATFQGQIGFVLKFAGVVDYFLERNAVDWDPAKHQLLESFEYYALAASRTFDALASGSKAINYAWERAVLCQGIYFIYKDGKHNMLHSTRGNNARRDYSWYRLLNLSLNQGDEWNQKQGFVKQVFDHDNFNPDNVVESLEAICSEKITADGFNETYWQHLLIINPAFFDVSTQGFVVLERETLFLMHQSKRNHNHTEIVTYYFNQKLDKQAFNIKPFDFREYTPQRGTDCKPSITIKWLEIDDGYYRLDLTYSYSTFTLTFTKDKSFIQPEDTLFSHRLRDFLLNFGFERQILLGLELDIFELSHPHFSAIEESMLYLCYELRGFLND